MLAIPVLCVMSASGWVIRSPHPRSCCVLNRTKVCKPIRSARPFQGESLSAGPILAMQSTAARFFCVWRISLPYGLNLRCSPAISDRFDPE